LASAFAFGLDLTGWPDGTQQVSSPNSRQTAWQPAWGQRAQGRVQSAYGLGAQAGEVVVAVDQQP
jgi:hypothetical protein